MPFTVGVALDGAGWHPAAWREPAARPGELFTARYWQHLVSTADTAGLDYATIDDSLHLRGQRLFDGEVPPRPRPGLVEGRLDALLIASWLGPNTRGIGLVPTVTTTYTEPFHVATALQTLDHVTLGRAGWQLRFSAGAEDAAAFGRRPAPEIDAAAVVAGAPDAGLEALLDEAADAAEVARRLWDSWEDDAIIRDVETGRFLDADRLHHIDFTGERFSVAGPSIVPRSPQGQPPVTLLAHAPQIFGLAARSADVVFVTPDNASPNAGASSGKSAAEIVAEVRTAEREHDRASRGLAPLRIVADLVVALDGDAEGAAARLLRLDELLERPFASDARIFAGGVEHAIELIAEWRRAGIEGVRLRPLALPDDLDLIAEALLPALRSRGLAAARPPADTGERAGWPSLRERFGLGPAENRYRSVVPEERAA
ncbi:LLM class flavin-dependent oxidoreductase [Leucobacter weissii]|uniref:LLM class flavin-dependent oxidoreductase n=1 Tax=Leucobacter weissii TaxID=1983706 RepID=UPI0031331818